MQITAHPLTEAEARSERFGNNNLMQSAPWGEFKRRRGHIRRRFVLETPRGQIALLGLTRSVGQDSESLHIPFGPELELTDEERGPTLEATARAISGYLPESCVFLRFDLPWPSPYTHEPELFGRDGSWLGPPQDRIRELRMNINTGRRNLRKAPTDINPPDTVILDLTLGEEEILARMRAKTRYNIRLAARRGVVVTELGVNHLAEWHKLYRETTERQGIVCEDYDYFRELFATVRNQQRTTVHLYGAWEERELLAGVIVAHHRNTAYYLYGAGGARKRNLMPAYALQWHAIRAAKAAGCIRYDMFGIPPGRDPAHPMYGLYRFKAGFGGQEVHYSGTWDYPLDLERYHALAQHETVGGKYHTGE